MKGYRTKRISLPGGRVIEIVYFFEPDEGGQAEVETAHAEVETAQAETAATRTHSEPPPFAELDAPMVDAVDALPPLEQHEHDHGEMHLCPSCSSGLVYPVAWEERHDDRWSIERRCPNCEWRETGEFCQDDVESFDDVLNEGTEDLLVALRNFARANMECDIERLIDAIQLDLIEPMDF
jgi:hypothetical protein